jgi:hypothetical protein
VWRDLTESESAEIFRSLEAARPLTRLDRHNLSYRLYELNFGIQEFIPPEVSREKQAAMLRELAAAAERLKCAFEAMTKDGWDADTGRAPWRLFLSTYAFMSERRWRRQKPVRNVADWRRRTQTFAREMKRLYRQLPRIAEVAQGSVDVLKKEVREQKETRPGDRAATYFIEQSAVIWRDITGRAPDAWFDKSSSQYKGKFWRFLRASSVVAREIFPEKFVDGALFARFERLEKSIRSPLPGNRRKPV